MIFSEMNNTLAVTMNPNWILYDTNVSTNSLNYKVSFDASIAAMYFASVVEKVIVSCNFTFQLMMHSATVNT